MVPALHRRRQVRAVTGARDRWQTCSWCGAPIAVVRAIAWRTRDPLVILRSRARRTNTPRSPDAWQEGDDSNTAMVAPPAPPAVRLGEGARGDQPTGAPRWTRGLTAHLRASDRVGDGRTRRKGLAGQRDRPVALGLLMRRNRAHRPASPVPVAGPRPTSTEPAELASLVPISPLTCGCGTGSTPSCVGLVRRGGPRRPRTGGVGCPRRR